MPSTTQVIRNLPPAMMAVLDAKAKARGMGRETYCRDVLINEACHAALDVKHLRLRDKTWPWPDGSDENRVAMNLLAMGFAEAIKRAIANGVSEGDLMAAMAGRQAPEHNAPNTGPTAAHPANAKSVSLLSAQPPGSAA